MMLNKIQDWFHRKQSKKLHIQEALGLGPPVTGKSETRPNLMAH